MGVRNMMVSCKDCGYIFDDDKKDEVYYLANGKFICTDCFASDSEHRRIYKLKPLELGVRYSGG